MSVGGSGLKKKERKGRGGRVFILLLVSLNQRTTLHWSG